MDQDIFNEITKGDLEKALQMAVKRGDTETADKIETSRAHLKDVSLYKIFYGAENSEAETTPIECMLLDNRMTQIFQLAANLHPRNMLDIACSDGLLLNALSYHKHIEKGMGVELSRSRVATAKKTAEYHKLTNVSFHQSMFEEFNVDEFFDFVFMGEVLEHCIDPKAFLEKAAKYLVPGGTFVVTVPIDRPPLVDYEIEHTKSGNLTEHVHFFNKDRLLDLVKGTGLKLMYAMETPTAWKCLVSVFKKSI